MERVYDLYNRSLNNAKSVIQSIRLPWKPESEPKFRMSVVTGDKRGAGTDANVYVTIHDSDERKSKTLRPQHTFKDDHERGSTTHLDFGLDAGVNPPFEAIEIWRDDFGAISLPFGLNKYLSGGSEKDLADWFLDRIEISTIDTSTNLPTSPNPTNATASDAPISTWIFPVHRWIHAGRRYFIPLYDSILPQDDHLRREFRLDELDRKREAYVYAEKVKGGPIQTLHLPTDENFSEKFFWTFVEKKASLMVVSRVINWTTSDWTSFQDLKDAFKMCLEPPLACDHWMADWWFGLQRVQGVEPSLITLCQEIPNSIDVPSSMGDLLERKTLPQCVATNRIFMCNLSILNGIKCKNEKQIAVPILLLYLNNLNELLPILIQLQQERAQTNPVYTPLDPPNTWLAAKMFYNNAEAQYHQSLTHLAFTHLLIEGVCAACHRTLSTSHPIFRLLAPHFLYLIAINKRGEVKLINPGGWVDSTMTQGTEGMFQLMAKRFLEWSFDKLNPIIEIQERGVSDPKVLPYYPYRDDAIGIYQIIRKYVSKIISRYYDTRSALRLDWELHNFRTELVSPFPSGLGLGGVPGTVEEGFNTIDEVVDTISSILCTCSIGHAAANAQQYDQYAFVPNYPGILTKDPPTTKVHYTASDLVSLLPSKEVTMDTIVITNLLSTPITNPLGDFEVQYLYRPQDVQDAHQFRTELQILSEQIKCTNETRRKKYEDLIPEFVPNSISI